MAGGHHIGQLRELGQKQVTEKEPWAQSITQIVGPVKGLKLKSNMIRLLSMLEITLPVFRTWRKEQT